MKMKDIFWSSVLNMYGINNFVAEKIFFNKLDRNREKCEKSNNPYYAIENAYYFDKQYFLEKWWDKLEEHEKVELLPYVWASKHTIVIYGAEWWLRFFDDTGFITNMDIERPKEDLVLYRASEELFKENMSWTDSLETALTYKDLKTSIGGEVKVFKATVPAKSVLAILGGDFLEFDGYETEVAFYCDEYVVNHNDLINIEEIE